MRLEHWHLLRLHTEIPLLTTVTRSLTVKLAIVVSAGRDESARVLGGEGDKRAQVILKLPLATFGHDGNFHHGISLALIFRQL